MIDNKDTTKYKPEILDERSPSAMKRLRELRRNKSIAVIDDFENADKELYAVENPKSIFLPPHQNFGVGGSPQKGAAKKRKRGLWIYYPWRACLVHTLDRAPFQKTRISRNFNLILSSEQKKFAGLKIGIAGLNVGNPAAICLALEGGGIKMKFADPDTLTLSNLNRFRAGVPDLGLNKAILSARQVYETNPFVSVEVWSRGLEEKTLERFLLKPKLDILIEEMDNLRLKIMIRELARKYRIPVIMVTGNGENLIADVERYDLGPRLPILSGHLKKSIYEKIMSGKKVFSGREKLMLARDFMGQKFLTKRLKKSFLEVGARLAGIPQLAEASFLRGAALCYLARKIAIGEKVPSGRYQLRLDTLIYKRSSTK